MNTNEERPISSEEEFYLCLSSSEGGHDVYLSFCGIWSGYSDKVCRQALEYYCSGNLAADIPVLLSVDNIQGFIDSDIFRIHALPWFQGITCDGERAARTLSILLYAFIHYHANPER